MPAAPEKRPRRSRLRSAHSQTEPRSKSTRRRQLFSRQQPAQEDDPEPHRRSFLAKPPAPGAARHVLSVLRDPTPKPKRPVSTPLPQSSILVGSGYDDVPRRDEPRETDRDGSQRSDSVTSSLRSASAAGAAGVLAAHSHPLEVDASEVSDSASSARDRRPSSSASTPPQNSSGADDFVFVDDVTPTPIALRYVGNEERDVPEAPSVSPVYKTVSPEPHAEPEDVAMLREENASLQAAFAAHRNETAVLMQSLRIRATDALAEVDELARQLKDTRRRLTRRVRELEDDAAATEARHAEELARAAAVEKQLRSELEMSRNTRAVLASHHTHQQRRFVRPEGSAVVTARRLRGPVATQIVPLQSDAGGLRGGNVVGGRLQNTISSSDFMGGIARTRSVGNVHEAARRKNSTSRSELHATRSGHASTNSTMLRRSSSAVVESTSGVSSRTMARRSLLRRAFIAHIHSSRYRTARVAWSTFLGGADGTPVSPEQFARAVRGLAVAADARDRDLDVLRAEVCGSEACDTGVVTWAMFLQFYHVTRHEST